jgi:hypothetical protein
MFIILLLYVWFEHPGHTYGGFVSAFLKRGMTSIFCRRADTGALGRRWLPTNELVAKFWRWEELCSRLEGPSARICNLLLGPPPSQAWWADHLAEATGWLEAELATWWQVDTELGSLRTSVACVRDLVLGQCWRIVFTGSVSVYGGGQYRKREIFHQLN